MTAAPFRIGLRVADVAVAAEFYLGLGFTEVGRVLGPEGQPVMAILAWGDAHLLLDALVGMPFPDTACERQTQPGPRGLGVAVGLTVDDLDAPLEYCRTHDCQVTAEPADQPWGDRVFECLDPWDYLWEFSTPTGDPVDSCGTTAERQRLRAIASSFPATGQGSALPWSGSRRGGGLRRTSRRRRR